MKKVFAAYSLTFVFAFFVVTPLNAQADDSQTHATIDINTEFQAVEGWGASLCWWAHMAGRWDDNKIDEIVDLITAPDKLNMNIFRYNIGGGDHPSHFSTPEKPGHMASGKGVRAEMQGFKASENAPYDWSADAGQRKIMLKIKEKRPDAVFEAFSNSPPWWMTFSGCSAGNHAPTENNLKPEYYEAFCDYLVDVCKHYKAEYGIEFKTLEPFNESLSNYWYYMGSQEGCHFDMKAQIEIVKILHRKLQASGLKTVIAVSDETNLNQFIAALNAYMADSEAMPLIGQLNTHTYSGSNEEREQVRSLVEKSGKTFWQSETGPSGGKTALESNLMLAQKCFNDLRHMRPTAWLDWQLLEEHNETWCQIRCNFNEQTWRIVKNFYVRMQITRFVKQGYIIVKTDNNDVLAAISPDKKELVICCVNVGENERTFHISINENQHVIKSGKVFQTGAIRNCEPLPDITASGNRFVFDAENRSITTFVFPLAPAGKY